MTKSAVFKVNRPRGKRRGFERSAARRRRERQHFTKDIIDMAANLLAALFAR
jgi:hypothetical protein